jgi:hypothetical protein
MSTTTMDASAHRLWRPCLLIVLMIAGGLVAADRAPAQSGGTVRGKVSWCTAARNYPAAYMRVTLLPLNRARSSVAYTDADGFYYFHAIPSGDYFLEIWYRGTSSRPMTYRIRALDQSRTDIQPICLK